MAAVPDFQGLLEILYLFVKFLKHRRLTRFQGLDHDDIELITLNHIISNLISNWLSLINLVIRFMRCRRKKKEAF